MKRKDFLKFLSLHNCALAREGAKHSIFENQNLSRNASVPRHRELNNFTVVAICRELGIPKPKKF